MSRLIRASQDCLVLTSQSFRALCCKDRRKRKVLPASDFECKSASCPVALLRDAAHLLANKLVHFMWNDTTRTKSKLQVRLVYQSVSLARTWLTKRKRSTVRTRCNNDVYQKSLQFSNSCMVKRPPSWHRALYRPANTYYDKRIRKSACGCLASRVQCHTHI